MDVRVPPAKVARIVERFAIISIDFINGQPSAVVMLELVTGAWVAQAIHVAAELGIADAPYGRSAALG
jgi:hypothetical protein